MCGIAGFIDFNSQSSESILRKATDILAHRGPDGSGYHFEQTSGYQIGLGHRRLSIIDLSNAASQPMRYKHLTIVYNGEIYNYQEIKEQLRQKGHQFDTTSDTEVILHAWEEWRTEMLTRFIGMFAFVIHDSRKNELFCFRDRAGVKPFYYYFKNNLFLFASELKSFHQHPGFEKELSHEGMHQYFQYGYIMAPLTIFRHTHKLEPGHYLHYRMEENSFSIHEWWNVNEAYLKPKLDISERDAKETMRNLLVSACEYRMVSDVPVGVFLSGGYDSTAVTALLQSGRTEKLKTFTIGFHEEDHNEAVFAKSVATHLGTDHTEYYCTTKEAQDIIPDIPFYCDEPFGDSSIIPTTLVSRLARKQVTVALSADAGDEIFAGYPKYTQAMAFSRNINRVPYFLRQTTSSLLKMMPDSLLVKLSGNKAFPIKKHRFIELLTYKTTTTTDLMDILLSQVYSNRQMDQLLRSGIRQPGSCFSPGRIPSELKGDLDRMLAVDYQTYMVDDILCKVDRTGMSVSLEGREPLLDHRIVEFAAQLPASFKIKNNIRKFLLKEIVHDYVPRNIMDRPKMGFAVPVAKWLREDLRFYADIYLNESELSRHDLFHMPEVKRIIRSFFEGDRNYNSMFWFLLMFQMWYKKWMD